MDGLYLDTNTIQIQSAMDVLDRLMRLAPWHLINIAASLQPNTPEPQRKTEIAWKP